MTPTPFPPDLIELQADWQRTYAALAVPHPAAPTALRRRLHMLSTKLLWHPYFLGPGRTSAARVELRRQARAQGRRP
ncbi:hypothetical protein OH768_52580 [Streptomyces sp. NBC_01622]|uniref:hypothetical protein n=1 Tax=Streptomyces sp. NBC_01622 TaxID=2975903 RepID=UPI00386EEEB6|nr:hypothetical protein OH768_52580 [Streptomyces sp. NBC_01622]